MFLFSTHSRIKWYLRKMCLVFSWLTGFSDMAIHAELSSKIIIDRLRSSCGSSSQDRSRWWIASWVAADSAWYSAWAVESATVVCVFDLQATGLPAMKKTYADTERALSLSDAQLESLKPIGSVLNWPKVIPLWKVPRRYLSRCLAAAWWAGPWQSLKRDSWPTA